MHWIPMTEQLPPKYMNVILSLRIRNNNVLVIGYYTDKGFWDNDNSLIEDGTVTAWMPMPEPYEGE